MMRRRFTRLARRVKHVFVLGLIRIKGPPRMLTYDTTLNRRILVMFGARIGRKRVRIHAPLTLHAAERGYSNLTIEDGCILGGNNYLDLSAEVVLEEGVSLGPGVTIMTHNRFNYNEYLENRLKSACGEKPVRIGRGSGIKADALITMGVTVGENAVVGGGAVVNRDVPAYCFVGGVPAKIIKELKKPVEERSSIQ